MTGLFIVAGLALLCLFVLKFGARIAWRDMSLPATALLIGMAGYAWQGHPGLIGHDIKANAPAAKFDEQLAERRRSIGERLGPASKWLVTSDGLARAGDTESAANILVSGLKDTPKDADLWVGLGNALVAHGDGRLSPAADYAFRQARTLAPEAISPDYFYGFALLRSGDLEAAKSVWLQLLRKLPQDSEFRFEMARNLVLLDRMMAQTDAENGGS